MYFAKEGNALTARHQGEILRIEPWGEDSLRARATKAMSFTDEDWALTEPVKEVSANISIEAENAGADIVNGKIKAHVNAAGVVTFYKDGKKILREYYSNYFGTENKSTAALKRVNREFSGILGASEYKLTVRFEPNDGEKLYGMGQYPQAYLDIKGCTLELAQKNTQTSVPFVLSNLGYGFFWNNPAVGNATFGKNMTEWVAKSTRQMDYYITVADTPAKIIENYTGTVGRAPVMPSELLGLWQCKLRYRTQDEVLSVARKYKELGIKLDVIVIDFFHWTRQGDWQFDKKYWPDPKAMCDELHANGTRVVVSVWPSVDRKSIHFNEMYEKGYLTRTDRGSIETYDYQGDCLLIDVTNPDARKYVWDICKKNYYDYGIDIFWLDNSEPDMAVYDYDIDRYAIGPAESCSNIYPLLYAKAFYDGESEVIKENPDHLPVTNLVRSGWAGSQKYGALLWSGDIQSTFEAFRNSVVEAIQMGIAGIPWWTTDIGGFMWGNVETDEFKELLIRWYEWAVYGPILRMHGDRDPHDVPVYDTEHDYGGGYLFTGRDNELWSYGEENFKIMKKFLEKRWALKPYLEKLMKEAHETGAPIYRAMFYEFPDDPKCYDLNDQYMFGDKYLVAPILELGQTKREVYLPAGKWTNDETGEVIEGGKTITVDAPIDVIPVFTRE